MARSGRREIVSVASHTKKHVIPQKCTNLIDAQVHMLALNACNIILGPLTQSGAGMQERLEGLQAGAEEYEEALQASRAETMLMKAKLYQMTVSLLTNMHGCVLLAPHKCVRTPFSLSSFRATELLCDACRLLCHLSHLRWDRLVVPLLLRSTSTTLANGDANALCGAFFPPCAQRYCTCSSAASAGSAGRLFCRPLVRHPYGIYMEGRMHHIIITLHFFLTDSCIC